MTVPIAFMLLLAGCAGSTADYRHHLRHPVRRASHPTAGRYSAVVSQTIVVIQAVDGHADLIGELALPGDVVVRFANTVDELREALPTADVMFGFDFKGTLLPQAWDEATDLRWIQWAGAGVDALLFPDLIQSDVTVTNAGGIYDDAIAEHVLALMLAHAKRLPDAVRNQMQALWEYRTVRPVAGSTALVLGAGGIGRAIARLLKLVGVEVTVAATFTRPDAEFGHVVGWDERELSDLDWLIIAAPLTPATTHIVDRSVLDELPERAVLINIGRGLSVDEPALVDALRIGRIAGAGLDVFEQEPLPAESPLWQMPNVIITPHHAGDVDDFMDRVRRLFLANLARYRAGEPLVNVVDKHLGYRSAY